MVTVAVRGRGYLGSVVARRWQEHGAVLVADRADYTVNAIYPDDLLLAVEWGMDGRLVQPSTDAIDEDTPYARTKRDIERLVPGVILRSGIVDIRHDHASAYANWWCNPLTPLEWADLAWTLRDRPGLHVAGRDRLTRYEVAAAVAREWDRPEPASALAPEPLDRVQPDDRTWPPLAEALREFHRWLR